MGELGQTWRPQHLSRPAAGVVWGGRGAKWKERIWGTWSELLLAPQDGGLGARQHGWARGPGGGSSKWPSHQPRLLGTHCPCCVWECPVGSPTVLVLGSTLSPAPAPQHPVASSWGLPGTLSPWRAGPACLTPSDAYRHGWGRLRAPWASGGFNEKPLMSKVDEVRMLLWGLLNLGCFSADAHRAH